MDVAVFASNVVTIFLFILLIGTCRVDSQLLTSAIYNELFGSNYTKDLIPICETGGNVTVKLGMALRQIMAINEREQIITINIWNRMTWNDCRLKWNPANHQGAKNFHVPYESVWVPDITLYDSGAEEVMMPGREDYKATIYYNGFVRYNFPTVLKAICRMDVTYFPYDTQECSLTFGSWAHHGFELDVVNTSSKGDLSNYVHHNEWEVADFPVIRHVFMYTCCIEPYPDVTFYLKLKRKAQFHVMTVLFPCILTSSVAAVSFILPPESGEKVSLSVTVLLSLAVFLLMVSEQLPASSDGFPYIGMYFAATMTLVALSCFMNVMVLNFYFRGINGRRVHRWVKIVVIDWLGYLVCSSKNSERFYKTHSHLNFDDSNSKVVPEINFEGPSIRTQHYGFNESTTESVGHKSDTNLSKPSTQDFLRPNADGVSGVLHAHSTALMKIEKHTEKEEEKTENNEAWHEVAFIVDRVFLVLFTFATALTSLIYITKMQAGN